MNFGQITKEVVFILKLDVSDFPCHPHSPHVNAQYPLREANLYGSHS